MKKILFSYLLALTSWVVQAQQLTISVSLDSSAKKTFSGRLYIFSVTDTTKGVQDPDPFNPTPTFYVDVNDWKAGETRQVDASAAGFPVGLDQLKTGFYKFAAVFDVDKTERNNTITAGNWYSRDVKVFVQPQFSTQVKLHLARQFPVRPFRETPQIKGISIKSEVVSAFRKQDSYIKAAIILPKNYDPQAPKPYSVVFVIPGWGGTQFDIYNPNINKRYGFGMGKDKIFVYLNPESSNPFGLHAFIDSRVNGPWGKALVEELIPYLSKNYRISSIESSFFLVGQSSGGYASVWLQTHYPKVFSGCWAVSPDPLDFQDFISINLYKESNLYYDKKGQERPFFLMKGQYLSSIKKNVTFEYFLGNGGQMQSFEAVYGLPAPDGTPQMMFNRNTGEINPAVVNSWKMYDLSSFLENNRKQLMNDLKGKIHVFAGSDDNFFLNRSVEKFKERLTPLSLNATIEIIEKADHWSIWTEGFTKQMHQMIDAQIQ